jgi:hypothetical protein
MYVCFFMLHILLLAVLSEKLCMFLYNLTVVTSQKLTVKAENTMILPKNSLSDILCFKLNMIDAINKVTTYSAKVK